MEEESRVYTLLAFFTILLVTVLLIAKFNIFPIFVDIFYHLAAMQGYNTANGITLNAYWEFAPFGRPQLYPPLLHLLVLLLLKTGASLVFIAKFTSFVMFPLTLLVLWLTARFVYGRRIAFFSVLFLSGSYAFFRHSSVLSAAALAQIFGLLSFLAIEKNKKFAAPVLIAMMLYSHIVIPYFYFIALLFYALFRKERRKTIFISLAIAAVLYSPWAVHTLRNLNYIGINSIRVPGFVPIKASLNLWLWGLGLLGAAVAFFKRGKYAFPLVLLVLLVPIAFNYPQRFWEAHSLLPLALLSGIFMSEFVSSVRLGVVAGVAIVSLLSFSLLFTPFLNFGFRSLSFDIKPSFVSIMIAGNKNPGLNVRRNGKQEFPDSRSGRLIRSGKKIMSVENIKFAENLKEKVEKGSTIYIPDGVFSDFLFAFSGIPGSSGMLREVKPYKRPVQKDCAYLEIPGDVPSVIAPLNKIFARVSYFNGRTLFKNKLPVKKDFPAKPVLPLSVCFILIAAGAIIVLTDFGFARRR